MKQHVRILGIDDMPFEKTSKKTKIVGAVFRGGEFLEGVMSTDITIDGEDATDQIAEMISSSRFRIQAVLLDGIAVGGFNVIDIQELNQHTGIPVIVIMRKRPDLSKIISTLKKLNMAKKIPLLKKAGSIHSYNSIYYQTAGTDTKGAARVLDITCTRSNLPEPIRVAHLVGAGIMLGESTGSR